MNSSFGRLHIKVDSKSVNGGTYRYLDENVSTGTSNVYRITEKEGNVEENDLSQCLVEICGDLCRRYCCC
jgi:hypothetical protein